MHIIQKGSAITIDHALTEEEFECLKTLLFSYGRIGQVYFKDEVDAACVNKVKYLLETSSKQDDAQIDKIVLVDEEKSVEILSSMVTQNPGSWQIAYQKDENRYKLTTLPKYRNMVSYINRVLTDAGLVDSQLEKIMVVYDELKKYTILENTYHDKLPDCIAEKRGSQKTLIELFSKVLTTMGITNYPLEYKSSRNKDKSVLLVDVDDEKHNINGLYFFAPLEECSKDCYHFFGITTEKLMRYNQLATPSELMGVLALEDDEFEHKIKYMRQHKLDSELVKMERKFGMPIEEIRQKNNDSPQIGAKRVYSIYSQKENALNIHMLTEKDFVENTHDDSLFRSQKVPIKIKK